MLGESIVVDWDALPDSTVVVRLRMIGPRLDTGDCSGVALAPGVLTYTSLQELQSTEQRETIVLGACAR